MQWNTQILVLNSLNFDKCIDLCNWNLNQEPIVITL